MQDPHATVKADCLKSNPQTDYLGSHRYNIYYRCFSVPRFYTTIGCTFHRESEYQRDTLMGCHSRRFLRSSSYSSKSSFVGLLCDEHTFLRKIGNCDH